MDTDPAGARDARLYRWRFGQVEFDEARHELRVAGLPVEIEHKPLQVLSLLLRHVGEVVTKHELFEWAWAGRITVDHVLATAIGKLRKALDAAGEQRIVTVPRVGYRLDGPVERVALGQRRDSALKFEQGQPVPGREHFVLQRRLGQTLGSEVWLAQQPRSLETRVFKFSLNGEQLSSIKREATLMRVLRDTLGERDDFVRVLDWNFETEPFFLECEYGGESLPEWAQSHGVLVDWDARQRIDFFLQIAQAVDAAHGVGVLHKDIKPANVLVRQRQGDRWQACLTDFGNSRLLQPERLAELGITDLGLTLSTGAGSDQSGTPLYLAPELIAGQPPTVRSDLYALGVLLYQLLVGDLRRPMAPGWERHIADPLLVDDITRATDGTPALRLGSVAELVERLSSLSRRREDALRLAETERAAAHARQVLDRARTRRPWIVATIAMLSAGLLASSLLWYRSEQERRDATMQAARAEAVVRFLSDDLLGALSPGGAGFERDPTIREMLEHADNALADRFGGDPATRGSIHAALGDAWRTLGDRERAASHLRKAVAEYTDAFGSDDELTLKTRYGLVRTLAYAGAAQGFVEAGQVLARADAEAGARLQGETEVALYAAIARGQFHFQQLQIEPSLQAHLRADALQRSLRPDDAQMAALVRANIADATLRLGRTEEAIGRLHALVSDPLLDPARVGESTVAGHRIMLARALRNVGRHEEALPLAVAAATATERIAGADDYSTLIQWSTVASIHDAAGDCRKALPIARKVRARMAARYGEERQATLIETGNLGFKEHECGDRDAGLTYLRQAESGLRAHFGEDNVAAHSFRHGLAKVLVEQGRYPEALEMVKGLDIAALTAGDATPGWEQRLQALRGRILLLSGNATEGHRLLSQALPALEALGTEDAGEILQLRKLLDAGTAGTGVGIADTATGNWGNADSEPISK